MRATLSMPRPATDYVAMQSVSYLKRQLLWDALNVWVDANAPGLDWHCGEVFHRASRAGTLYPLVAAMQQRRVVVVGPGHLRKFPFAAQFVEVSGHNCWRDYAAIAKQLLGLTDCVVSFSAPFPNFSQLGRIVNAALDGS
jgi:hypothetical protein